MERLRQLKLRRIKITHHCETTSTEVTITGLREARTRTAHWKLRPRIDSAGRRRCTAKARRPDATMVLADDSSANPVRCHAEN
jgi:hypothetical protein